MAFGLRGRNAVASRPERKAPASKAAPPHGLWARVKSYPGATDGYELTDDDVNEIVGQLRNLLVALGGDVAGETGAELSLAVTTALAAKASLAAGIAGLADSGGYVRMTDAERDKLAAVSLGGWGSFAGVISDWNAVTGNGFYQSLTNAANGPVTAGGPASRYIGIVEARAAGYCTQTVHAIGETTASPSPWRRQQVAGAWGPWTALVPRVTQHDIRSALGYEPARRSKALLRREFTSDGIYYMSADDHGRWLMQTAAGLTIVQVDDVPDGTEVFLSTANTVGAEFVIDSGSSGDPVWGSNPLNGINGAASEARCIHVRPGVSMMLQFLGRGRPRVAWETSRTVLLDAGALPDNVTAHWFEIVGGVYAYNAQLSVPGASGGLTTTYTVPLVDGVLTWDKARARADLQSVRDTTDIVDYPFLRGLLANTGGPVTQKVHNPITATAPMMLRISGLLPSTYSSIDAAPAAASALSVNFASNDATVLWTQPATPSVAGARIYRGLTSDSAAATLIATVSGAPSAAMSYADNDRPPGTYWWWVEAVNASGVGAGRVLAGTVIYDDPAPSAVTGLDVDLSLDDVLVSWTQSASWNAASARVYRGTTNVSGDATLIATISGAPSTAMSYADNNLAPGTYWWWVEATNIAGSGGGRVLAGTKTVLGIDAGVLAISSLTAIYAAVIADCRKVERTSPATTSNVGDPVGTFMSLVGSKHLAANADANRPVLQADTDGHAWLVFDGDNDALAFASTLPGVTHVVAVLSTSDADGVLISHGGIGATATPLWPVFEDGSAAVSMSGPTTPSVKINRGSHLNTRDTLHDALAVGTPVVLTASADAMSGASGPVYSGYGAAASQFRFSHQLYAMALLTSPSAGDLAAVEEALAALAGVTLP